MRLEFDTASTELAEVAAAVPQGPWVRDGARRGVYGEPPPAMASETSTSPIAIVL